MTGQRGLFVVGALMLTACVAGVLIAEDAAAPTADVELLQQELGPGQTVPMAEVTQLQGRRVEGRIVYEDAERIDLERPGGSVTGYAKHLIRPDIRRFGISQMEWVEMDGDLRQNGALDSRDPSVELLKALHSYQQARLLATDAKGRDRLDAKANAVLELQDAWHAESVRRQDLEIMAQQAELLKLEQQLTTEKLAALKQQGAEIVRLRADVQRLQQDNRRLGFATENIAQAVADLEDQMDELDDLNQILVRTNVIVQLRQDQDQLARQVRQLQTAAPRNN
jgi:hypothetical protein